MKHLDFIVAYLINQRLELLQLVKAVVVGFDWINPNLLRKIIDKCDKLLGALIGRGFHRPTYIGIHNLEFFGSTSCPFNQKWQLLLLAFNATLTNK